ncbi:hypothetical protein ABT269_25865, partial [Streptomyces viridosporus]|uniref:hypothetical protein n=1 Tax=Streptomyces viridosporus TaxID=67581 RepID=UPI00332C2239
MIHVPVHHGDATNLMVACGAISAGHRVCLPGVAETWTARFRTPSPATTGRSFRHPCGARAVITDPAVR